MSSFSELPWATQIDFISLIASDFFDMDVRCDRSHLYKYLSFRDAEFRQSYLVAPTLKFATKSELNDPFDLSRRFDRFGGELFRKFLKKNVLVQVEEHLADRSYLLGEIAKLPAFTASGMTSMQLNQILDSPVGAAAVEAMRAHMRSQLPAFVDMVLDHADGRIDEFLAGPISRTGVLSLSEAPDNRALWSVYADAGDGFVLEVNAQHPFFVSRQKDDSVRNRLMRVFYRDDRMPDIWTNPYYLFSVKHTDFAFEREWRLIRSIDDCAVVALPDSRIIYTVPVPRGLITSIIFGHRWTDAAVAREGRILQEFDEGISVKRAFPNDGKGTYEIVELAPPATNSFAMVTSPA